MDIIGRIGFKKVLGRSILGTKGTELIPKTTAAEYIGGDFNTHRLPLRSTYVIEVDKFEIHHNWEPVKDTRTETIDVNIVFNEKYDLSQYQQTALKVNNTGRVKVIFTGDNAFAKSFISDVNIEYTNRFVIPKEAKYVEFINVSGEVSTMQLFFSSYSGEDYFKARQNALGISRAIKYASDNGFTNIVLPKGNYWFTYNDGDTIYDRTKQACINMVSNTNFYMIGCKLKVMFESYNKSPYGSTDRESYMHPGMLIALPFVSNCNIYGGELIGDKYERVLDGKTSGEFMCEHTYGIIANVSSRNNSINNTIIRGFMGDQSSAAGTGYSGIYDPVLYKGGLDDKTGQPLPEGDPSYNIESKIYTTDFQPVPEIPEGMDKTFALMTGIGYVRIPYIMGDELFGKLYWYDTNKNFIGMEIMQFVAEQKIPDGAAFLRYSAIDVEPNTEPTTSIGVQLTFVPGRNLIYNQCTFADGHRGGWGGGIPECTLNQCFFVNNGEGWREGGKVYFGDPTRYHINCEDNYGRATYVNNCTFIGGFHGILAGVHTMYIDGCEFYNNHGIIAYNNSLLSITNNRFMMSGVHPQQGNFGGRTLKSLTVTGNLFIESTVNAQVSGLMKSIYSNNICYRSTVEVAGDTLFTNNLVIEPRPNSSISKNTENNHYIGNGNFEDEKGGYLYLAIYESAGNNNTFENIALRFTQNQESINISNNKFINCLLSSEHPGQKSIALHNTILDNTVISPNPKKDKQITVSIRDSKIFLGENKHLIYSGYAYEDTQADPATLAPNRIFITNSDIILKGNATLYDRYYTGYVTDIRIDDVKISKDTSLPISSIPTFSISNSLDSEPVNNMVRINKLEIDPEVSYTSPNPSKMFKNTQPPTKPPVYIGDEYIYYEDNTIHILRGIGTSTINDWFEIATKTQIPQ